MGEEKIKTIKEIFERKFDPGELDSGECISLLKNDLTHEMEKIKNKLVEFEKETPYPELMNVLGYMWTWQNFEGAVRILKIIFNLKEENSNDR